MCAGDTDLAASKRAELFNLIKELPEAMKKLQSGNIALVDLAQAAIGPGMAVFSRYSKVVESDGAAMTVRTALTLINQSPADVFAKLGIVEEDADKSVHWMELFSEAGMV